MIPDLKKTQFYRILIDYTLDKSVKYVTYYSKAKQHCSKLQTYGPIRHRLCI